MFEAPILVSPFTTKSISFSFLCVAVHSCSIDMPGSGAMLV